MNSSASQIDTTHNFRNRQLAIRTCKSDEHRVHGDALQVGLLDLMKAGVVLRICRSHRFADATTGAGKYTRELNELTIVGFDLRRGEANPYGSEWIAVEYWLHDRLTPRVEEVLVNLFEM